MKVSEERCAEIARSVERARAVLEPGDRLRVGTCGNRRGVTVTMTGWSEEFPGFITTKTLTGDEIHPVNIYEVNGEARSFADPPQNSA